MPFFPNLVRSCLILHKYTLHFILSRDSSTFLKQIPEDFFFFFTPALPHVFGMFMRFKMPFFI